ncbi:MAG TPA: type II toxin-antitoxin system VapC family toxin [Bryobacteraceae bacterium]|jgi:predicted nucleic acid-binding protein|nr:type II toxin-antitoxin system VapC family toxin [Bryobacteraceae bacterium]
MKVYLDACCINRFTDDQSQERIRRETAAIEMILKRVRRGSIQWVSSEPLSDEIHRNPDVDRRLETAALLTRASDVVEMNAAIAERASRLESAGYEPYDALHLACAEVAHVDVLLTTDDGFVRRASRGSAVQR